MGGGDEHDGDRDEEVAALVPRSAVATAEAPTIITANIEIPASVVAAEVVAHSNINNATVTIHLAVTSFWDEVWTSTELLFQSKLTWLLLVGPIAVYGDSTGYIGEATCFTCAGLALIPCAERLSFVTEQVAEHTNGTIGALLNATFGNAPELLIAAAALRSGFYRVVQLAMLGSILTNLLFVFGMSCLVGGIRWQVQNIRVISGNVSVGMLYLATAGSLLPAALFLSGQLPRSNNKEALNDEVPTKEELVFCRINAAVMVFLYLCYLLFQLGTHKEEFDDDNNNNGNDKNKQQHSTSDKQLNNHPAKRNLWCQHHAFRGITFARRPQFPMEVPATGGANCVTTVRMPPPRRLEKVHLSNSNFGVNGNAAAITDGSFSSKSSLSDTDLETDHCESGCISPPQVSTVPSRRRRRHRKAGHQQQHGRKGSAGLELAAHGLEEDVLRRPTSCSMTLSSQHSSSESRVNYAQLHWCHNQQQQRQLQEDQQLPLLTFRAGILWLFIITLCISSMSDILVDTLEGFAKRSNMSQVFTSLVVVPYFSNIAEQASAVLFAYRNEMDLCVGVTVGSAIQIGAFVMPGSVLIGYMMDRSMTLYFHGFETMCYLFAVVVAAAVLQGGTTNWLVGATMIGVYVMMAAGFWVHETEDLSVDAEDAIRNATIGGT